MTTPCEQLAAFVDGELPEEEARAFSEHLAGCADCQAALEDQVQASVAVRELGEARRQERRAPFQPTWARRRARALGLSAGVAAAVVMGVLAFGTWRSSRQPLEDPLMLARAETRPLEGRLSYPGADRYRQLATMRSGTASATTGPDHRVLAELEERGDFHGVATAYLLAGDFARAEAYLDRLPPAPDVDSDRAMAALGRGEHERALQLLDRALAAEPEGLRHHWNRGVALRAMALELAAAAQFQRVADKGEPGWAEEARRLAEGLRGGAEARRKSWQDMKAAGMALVMEGEPPPPAMVRRNPGMARLFLYHAVRAATTREQVLALLPVAESVDQVSGTRAASEYVQRVSREDFARRGPLAKTFRALLGDIQALSEAEKDAYLERLRRLRERDLLLGALILLHAEWMDLEELEALVRESADPAWYQAPLAMARALVDLTEGRAAQAERHLLEAIDGCRRANLEYRCVTLQEKLSELYNKLDRRQEAAAPAREALEVARRIDDWHQEDQLVYDLMTSARLRHEHALARAWLDEYLQRDPENCERRAEYHFARAIMAVETLDVSSARREVQAARACDVAPTLFEIAVYADLLRFGATDEEEARVEERIRALRASQLLTTGEELFLEHMAGRILIERERAGGQKLLREVIAGAEKLRASDIEARKAWSHSHHVLVMDAGRAGEFDAAITLLSGSWRGRLPRRACSPWPGRTSASSSWRGAHGAS